MPGGLISGTHFPGRLAIQQRVLAAYRAPFFSLLAQACGGGLSICAGLPRLEESIAVTDHIQFADFTSIKNIHLFRGAFYLCFQPGLPDWLETCQPDALILEANPRYIATPAALRWMKDRERPVLGWGLGAPLHTGPFSGFRKSRRASFLRGFDTLLTYSRRGAEEYAALGFPAEKIFVAPNAAAARPSQPMPSRPKKINGKATVLFVGRLQFRKRVDLLLQACASLPQNLQPRLIIVGDGPERLALEALANDIYPVAEFHGARHGQELAGLFSAADLFVLPGTGGLAVQEAMSHGLPIIMGQGDGTNDDLVRAENGWQIPPDDISSLATALQMALTDSSRLRAMGAESYRRVAEEVNLERMVEVFVEAINSIK